MSLPITKDTAMLEEYQLALAEGQRVYATLTDPNGVSLGIVRIYTLAYAEGLLVKGNLLSDYSVGPEFVPIRKA